MTRIRFLIPIALLASLTANPTFAQAHDWDEPMSEAVSYADLDLTSLAGVATLDGRIDRAIRKVCGKPYMDLASSQSVRRCRKEARMNVQSQRTGALAAANAIQFSARER